MPSCQCCHYRFPQQSNEVGIHWYNHDEDDHHRGRDTCSGRGTSCCSSSCSSSCSFSTTRDNCNFDFECRGCGRTRSRYSPHNRHCSSFSDNGQPVIIQHQCNPPPPSAASTAANPSTRRQRPSCLARLFRPDHRLVQIRERARREDGCRRCEARTARQNSGGGGRPTIVSRWRTYIFGDNTRIVQYRCRYCEQ